MPRLTLVLACLIGFSAHAAERLVTLTATITVSNSGSQEIRGYIQRLTIPPSDHAQQKLLRVESADPDYAIQPHDNGVDSYVKFKWNIPPHSKVEREIRFPLRLTSFDHARKPIAKGTHNGRDFLSPSNYVESASPEIGAIAARLRVESASPTEQLRAAFLYPQRALRYTRMDNRGALHALRTGLGDCTEYAAIFIGVARALGFPARMTSEFNFAEERSFSEPNHHAAEVYLDGAWVPIDPNLALDPRLGYGFGTGGVSKVILKRGDSWVWSNSIPGVSRDYREGLVKVQLRWRVSDSP